MCFSSRIISFVLCVPSTSTLASYCEPSLPPTLRVKGIQLSLLMHVTLTTEIAQQFNLLKIGISATFSPSSPTKIPNDFVQAMDGILLSTPAFSEPFADRRFRETTTSTTTVLLCHAFFQLPQSLLHLSVLVKWSVLLPPLNSTILDNPGMAAIPAALLPTTGRVISARRFVIQAMIWSIRTPANSFVTVPRKWAMLGSATRCYAGLGAEGTVFWGISYPGPMVSLRFRTASGIYFNLP